MSREVTDQEKAARQLAEEAGRLLLVVEEDKGRNTNRALIRTLLDNVQLYSAVLEGALAR